MFEISAEVDGTTYRSEPRGSQLTTTWVAGKRREGEMFVENNLERFQVTQRVAIRLDASFRDRCGSVG